MADDMIPDHMHQDLDIEEAADNNFHNFEVESKEIFHELFSTVMKAKCLHGIPNEGLDMVIRGFKIASEKSNNLFLRKLKQLITSKYGNKKILTKWGLLFHLVK